MPITAPPQPQAGQFIRDVRENELGLRVADFCQLVSQQETKFGRVNLDRNGLRQIEEFGIVPLPPRRWAIAQVLDMDPRDIWITSGSRRYQRTPHRRAA